MNKAEEYFNQLLLQSHSPKIDGFIGRESLGYTASWSPGKMMIQASSALLACQGAVRSLDLWRAGFPEQALGEHTPALKKRYFSLERGALADELLFMNDEEERHRRFDALCKRVVALGFNGVMFSDFSLDTEPLEIGGYAAWARSYGLRFGSMWNPDEAVDDAIYVSRYWTQILSREQSDFGAIKLDVLLRELRAARDALDPSAHLIYYIPAMGGSKRFWEQLFSHIPVNTSIAFRADGADSFWPVWRSLAASYSHLIMPILSPAQQGKGLWPLVDSCRQDSLLGSNFCHLWKGAIVASPVMPSIHSLLHGELWSLSRRLWEPEGASSLQLYEQWFKRFIGEEGDISILEMLGQLTQLARSIDHFLKEASGLSYDQQRSFLEYALAQLKFLNLSGWGHFEEQVEHCITDLRRLLFHAMLQFQVTLPQTVGDQDLKGGVWTTMKAVAGQAVRSGAVVQILDRPQRHDSLYSRCVCWWEEEL